MTATVYGSIPIQDRYEEDPRRRRSMPVGLHELLALAQGLGVAGYPTGEAVERVEAISTAIDAALDYDLRKYLGDDVASMRPEDVADGVRQAAIDLVAREQMRAVHTDVQQLLAQTVSTILRAVSDDVIGEMRTRFDPAVKVVRNAAEKGLTPTSDTATLLETATAEVLAAYRAVGPAVSVLDGIAALRNTMTMVADIGPADWPIAGFVTGVTSLLHMEGAQTVWRGDSEIVQVVQQPYGGAHNQRRKRPRLGGPWVALVAAGYQLRLNTGSEADAVLATASEGDEV